jgi:hypothetical protein
MNLAAQLAHFPAQLLHESNELCGGVARSLFVRETDLNQLATHSQQAVAKTTRIEKNWTCFHYGKRTMDDWFGEALPKMPPDGYPVLHLHLQFVRVRNLVPFWIKSGLW